MTRNSESDDDLPTGFEKMVSSISGAIEDRMENGGPWHGYIEEFDLIDPTDGTEYTHRNGSLQGRWGREVGILAETGDIPDDAPLDPKGWIVEYTTDDTDGCVRGTVVGFDSIVEESGVTHHILYFVPDPSSDPDRDKEE